METPAPGGSGWLGSLRGLADGLLGSVQNRFELLSVDLHAEKQRLLRSLAWLGAVMFCAVMAVGFSSLALLVIFWDRARVAVVCGLAGGYLIALAVALLGLKRHLKRTPRPFAATLADLRGDREYLRPRDDVL